MSSHYQEHTPTSDDSYVVASVEGPNPRNVASTQISRVLPGTQTG